MKLDKVGPADLYSMSLDDVPRVTTRDDAVAVLGESHVRYIEKEAEPGDIMTQFRIAIAANIIAGPPPTSNYHLEGDRKQAAGMRLAM